MKTDLTDYIKQQTASTLPMDYPVAGALHCSRKCTVIQSSGGVHEVRKIAYWQAIFDPSMNYRTLLLHCTLRLTVLHKHEKWSYVDVGASTRMPSYPYLTRAAEKISPHEVA